MILPKTNKYCTYFIVDWVTRIFDDCKRTKQPPYQSVKSRSIRKKMHAENDEGNGVTAERNLSVSVLVLCGTTEAKKYVYPSLSHAFIRSRENLDLCGQFVASRVGVCLVAHLLERPVKFFSVG